MNGNDTADRLQTQQKNYEAERKDFFDRRYMAHQYADDKSDKNFIGPQHTLLASVYPEFTEDQLRSLYIYAMLHAPDNIEPDYMEIWVCDYIAPYYYKIKATSSETNSGFFSRLLWMVNKDIDHIAKSIKILHF